MKISMNDTSGHSIVSLSIFSLPHYSSLADTIATDRWEAVSAAQPTLSTILSYPPHTLVGCDLQELCMCVCLSSSCQVVFVTCVLRFALCFIAAASNRLFRCAIAIVFVVTVVVTCYCACCYLHWANSRRAAKLCTVEQICWKCRVQNRKVHTNMIIGISIN